MSRKPKGYSTQPYKQTVTTKRYEFKMDTGPLARTCFVPEGWPVSNQTSMGPDDNYRFPMNPAGLAKLNVEKYPEALAHDLTYHGPNIPAEFCAPWPETPMEKFDREWKERQKAYPMLSHVYADTGGERCPFCGCTDIVKGGLNESGFGVSRADACNQCQKKWHAVFKLDTYRAIP